MTKERLNGMLAKKVKQTEEAEEVMIPWSRIEWQKQPQ